MAFLASLLQSSWFRLVAIDFGIQWVGCILAIVFKTEKFYDLTGSMTFILITYLSQAWSDHSWRQFIQSHMVMAWACRLGLFLFLRVMKDGQDKRFDEAKQEPLRFLVFWTLQGVWVIVTLLPTLWLNDNSRRVPIGIRDYIGWGIWVLGMFFEVTADLQKSIFRNNPDNKSKFIQSGLWSISRHPNYFGEILLWYGLYISASSVFRGSEYLLVLSPIFVQLLITKVSGIPLLEKASDKKWANLAEYQTYKRNTSVLVPFWPWWRLCKSSVSEPPQTVNPGNTIATENESDISASDVVHQDQSKALGSVIELPERTHTVLQINSLDGPSSKP